MFGNLGKRQRACGVHNYFAVHLDARERCHRRTGSEHDILCAHGFTRDFDAVLAGEGSEALKPLDLVFLEQEGDAACQLADGLALLGMHLRQIEAGAFDIYPKLRESARLGFLVQRGRVEQRLRWDAADIETRSAQGLARLCACSLQPELRRAYGRDITARTGTDDKNVVVVISHL